MKHKTVDIPYSRFRERISLYLKNDGYVKDYKIVKKNKFPYIIIELKYFKKNPCIYKINAVSKPSLRVYKPVFALKKFQSHKTYVMSTSKGIMSHKKAIEEGVGGEVLFHIS